MGIALESALIVSPTEQSAALIKALLHAASISRLAALCSCGEVRRLLLERDFDLVVINAPLHDESGESLSRHIAARGATQVVLIVANEHFNAVSAACEDDGVLTVAKPLDKSLFWSALTLAKAAWRKIKAIEGENAQLKQKIEDIRVIDRAKCLLISCLKMSEEDAHRYIEKQAMDMRSTKRAVAEGILKLYEAS